MLFGMSMLSCSKETSIDPVVPEKPTVTLAFDAGGEENLSLAANKPFSTYSFGGVAGVYFGSVSNFKGEGDVSFDITFGTSIVDFLNVTLADIQRLITPGTRKFGSLGAFSSFPSLDSGMVEITYTDRQSRCWCSTRITEKKTNQGVETSTGIEQAGSSFVIEEIEKTKTSEGLDAFLIRGRFQCFIYELNGDAKKKIKGKFEAMAGVEG